MRAARQHQMCGRSRFAAGTMIRTHHSDDGCAVARRSSLSHMQGERVMFANETNANSAIRGLTDAELGGVSAGALDLGPLHIYGSDGNVGVTLDGVGMVGVIQGHFCWAFGPFGGHT
jgi:hypothetical protein